MSELTDQVACVLATNCYVVDDDEEFRNSLTALLNAAGYTVSSFGKTEDFLTSAPQLEPGTLLLDLRMPGLSGLDMLEAQSTLLNRFAVIMISGHGDIERAVRSIKAGAIEFIQKPFEPSELLQKLSVVEKILTAKIAGSAERQAAETKVATLSPREFEVLRLLLTGAPNKIVARTLSLSIRTVEMHRAHMLTKLGARSTAQAIHTALLANVSPYSR